MVQHNELYEHKQPLNEKNFKKFLQDEMIVKEAKAFKDLVDKRFSYIVHKIAENNSTNVSWFDYDNSDGGEGVGFFNTDRYNEYVFYTGEFESLSYIPVKSFTKYDNSFPTKWFYQNFELALKKEKEDFLQEQKNQQEQAKLGKEKAKIEFEKVKDSIKKKLTIEELNYISFLSMEEVKKNQDKHVKTISKDISKDIATFIKDMKQQGVDVSEMYQHYRMGKKKPKNFYEWVMKNRQEIKSKVKKVPIQVASWPFPTN